LLAKPAGSIPLLDVFGAVEDRRLFTLHRLQPMDGCAVGGNIQDALRPVLDRASAAMEAELAAVTIADIAAEVARLGRFTIPLHWK
jgi:DNA-binding IscR family transcriptional regulator